MTPYEILKSLSDSESYLELGLSFEILDMLANQDNDNQATDQLQQARQLLFKTIYEQNLITG